MKLIMDKIVREDLPSRRSQQSTEVKRLCLVLLLFILSFLSLPISRVEGENLDGRTSSISGVSGYGPFFGWTFSPADPRPSANKGIMSAPSEIQGDYDSSFYHVGDGAAGASSAAIAGVSSPSGAGREASEAVATLVAGGPKRFFPSMDPDFQEEETSPVALASTGGYTEPVDLAFTPEPGSAGEAPKSHLPEGSTTARDSSTPGGGSRGDNTEPAKPGSTSTPALIQGDDQTLEASSGGDSTEPSAAVLEVEAGPATEVSSGGNSAELMVPVPEPETYLTLGASLAIAVILRRKRQKT